jgi:hypothetical protein
MERKWIYGIVAGGLVAAGLGIAGLRHSAAPGPDEAAESAKLRALGDRIPRASSPQGSPLAAATALPPLPAAGQAAQRAPAASTAAAVAVPHLKVPPTKKAFREESRRVARERAIAQGRLPEFEAAEKKNADEAAKKKAEREKRKTARKARLEARRKAVEAALAAGGAPDAPKGRRMPAPGALPAP